MAKKASTPEIIELTEEELSALFARIDQNTLTEEDKQLVKGAVHSNMWLRQALEVGKMTLHKLRRLLFGFRSEKRKKPQTDLQTGDGGTEGDEEGERHSLLLSSPELLPGDKTITEDCGEGETKAKGHGRLGVDSYPDAETIMVSHVDLKAGDPCPEECGGRLYPLKPGLFIRIKGQNIVKVIKYQVEKLRCALCGTVFKAQLPQGVREDEGKYDFRFKAMLATHKYFGGVPFYRQEHIQDMLGIPLPDSTQWDLIEQLANDIYPLIEALEDVAAAGELIHNDDTGVRIVEIIRMNRLDPTRERKGMYTTTLFARAGPHEIVLYRSGTKHAGENLADILKKRPKELPPIIHMSDALAANLAKEFLAFIAKCLAHGRRQFTDIEPFFPKECGYVIEEMGKVYHHDQEAKEKALSAEERLVYHQTHSAPLMTALKQWLDDQVDENKKNVEPNSSLGKAINYVRRHWEGLTLFLRIAGAPLDNNICERMIKVAIRLRKNSLIHRTCHGAHVASILMSLIQTCRLAGVNPIEYLTVCQENKKALFKHPADWLPWTYKETLAQVSLAHTSMQEYERAA